MDYMTTAYQALKASHLVKSERDFSTRYLKRSASFVSSWKSRDRDWPLTSLMTLAARLNETSKLLEQSKYGRDTATELSRLSRDIGQHIYEQSLV